MGGFSSNYEGGYEDFDGLPKWMNAQNKEHPISKDKHYKKTKTSTNQYLKVLLSNSVFLTDKEAKKRDTLCQYCENDIFLYLKHESDKKDIKQLALYDCDVFIGYIQKHFKEDSIDNTQLVNDFCFDANGLQEIEALWDGLHFYLKKRYIPIP